MNAVNAVWSNGRIWPAEPVDWPEGAQLLVEPLPACEQVGLDESNWSDDPEEIEKWCAAVKSIEPLEWAPGEEEEYLRYREQHRQFNIEAVRRQMEAMPEGEQP